MRQGKVKWYNGKKCFGFISPDTPNADGNTDDVFVHSSSLKAAGIRFLNENDIVEFEEEVRNGKLSATTISVVQRDEESALRFQERRAERRRAAEERKQREAQEAAARAARDAEIERENREYEQVKSQLAARENDVAEETPVVKQKQSAPKVFTNNAVAGANRKNRANDEDDSRSSRFGNSKKDFKKSGKNQNGKSPPHASERNCRGCIRACSECVEYAASRKTVVCNSFRTYGF